MSIKHRVTEGIPLLIVVEGRNRWQFFAIIFPDPAVDSCIVIHSLLIHITIYSQWSKAGLRFRSQEGAFSVTEDCWRALQREFTRNLFLERDCINSKLHESPLGGILEADFRG
jgi:hypothetical protein